MTLEEIEGLTPEQLDKINQHVIGLVKKNEELVKKVNAKGIESTYAELERLKALETAVQQKEEEDKRNYQKALSLRDEAHSKTLQELKERTASYERKLIETELILGLEGIRPKLKTAAQAMFINQITVQDGIPTIADKPLSDYLSEWKKSDDAKEFLIPSGPRSDGLPPSGHHTTGSNQLPEVKRVDFDMLDPIQQRSIALSGAKIVD